MEFLLENILNLVGFIIGIIIGAFAYVGYKNTGSTEGETAGTLDEWED